MASLKEIKGRIGSVKSTLKITSAMKLVASAKLRHAQHAIEGMHPYEAQLHGILADLLADYAAKADLGKAAGTLSESIYSAPRETVRRAALVVFTSNSSLCGAFNANAVRLALEAVKDYPEVTVYAVGRKGADALRKAGFPSPHDYTALAEKPSYADASALAGELMAGFADGTYDRVELIYNHFVSTATQKPIRQTLLPFPIPAGPSAAPDTPGAGAAARGLFLVEPSTEYELHLLLPKVLKLEVYTALLDSAAAEHAARTVAMQTATDNGEDLLHDLTLAYNKSRQQKITNEILDLVGGSL